MRKPGRLAATLLLAAMPLGGCFHLGPERLDQDQTNYSRALTNSDKRQALLNIVRLRYADTPNFLDATQVIAGYQLQRSVTGGFEAFPRADPSTYINGAGTVQMQESPTFTFQPVTGEAYAESFLRPLSPGNLLPLVVGGLPVDVLFRLAVQSVNGLRNAGALAGRADYGSPLFFALIHDLRLLQVAGLLDIQLQHSAKAVGEKGDTGPGRVALTIAPTRDPDLQPVAAETRRLLGMAPGMRSVEIVYGGGRGEPGQVRLLTRSMLGVLAQIGYQIDVPAADIASGRTLPTIGLVGGETKAVVVIHVGQMAPKDAFSSVDYRNEAYWIDDRDFDSKLAFTMLQILLALAKTSNAPGAVITIPAG